MSGRTVSAADMLALLDTLTRQEASAPEGVVVTVEDVARRRCQASIRAGLPPCDEHMDEARRLLGLATPAAPVGAEEEGE